MGGIHLRSLQMRGLAFVAAALAVGGACSSVEAALYFSESFAYANGDLAGNGGGTGWQGGSVWSGGTGSTGNQVNDPLPGMSGKSIQISSNVSETWRRLNATYTSGGATTYYISFAFNAAPFQGLDAGPYAGVALYLEADRSNNLMAGMPGSSAALGFDWTNRAGLAANAVDATTYLALLEIKPGTAANTTNVNLYVTTDLSMSGTALASSTAWVAAGDDPSFSFDSVGIAGSYSTGSISIAGLAMADNPAEAVSFTQTAVPEPATTAMALAAAAILMAGWRRLRL